MHISINAIIIINKDTKKFITSEIILRKHEWTWHARFKSLEIIEMYLTLYSWYGNQSRKMKTLNK